MVELASHFKAVDTDVVFSAIHGDEMKVSRWTGKIFSSFEGAIGDHHHAIRTSAFEECMSEKDRFFDVARGIRCLQAAPQLPQPSLVRRKRRQQTRLGAGTDDHHLLVRSELIH